MEFLLIALVVLVLAGAAALFRAKGGGASGTGASGTVRGESRKDALPTTLPVAVKPSFFSRSEQAFFGNLTAVLEGTPYTVFPNVRLNDLFTITDREQRQNTYNRAPTTGCATSTWIS